MHEKDEEGRDRAAGMLPGKDENQRQEAEEIISSGSLVTDIRMIGSPDELTQKEGGRNIRYLLFFIR